MAMKVCIKLLLVFLISHTLHWNGVQGRIGISIKEELEPAEQLKILNKEPIKSIQDLTGDTFNSAKIRPAGDGDVHPGQSLALLEFSAEASNKYFGAEGYMSKNNPPVGPEQSSWSLVSVESGDKVKSGNYSVLQGGWGVSPQLFGDSRTRLIAYWSSYSYGQDEGGCYNDACRGFVHTNKDFPFNYAVENISEYGLSSHAVHVSIQQDNKTKNWLLTFGNIILGHWTNDVVPHLTDGADRISFGGITAKSPDGISPPMGFGKFPDDSLLHSGYFTELHAITKEGTRVNPSQPVPIVDHPNCYKINPGRETKNHEYWFTYGGPGGACFASTN